MATAHSVFAIEVCLRMDHAPQLVPTLRGLLAHEPAATTHQAKWRMYGACVQVLQAHLQYAERGCWDFFDEDQRARDEFDGWTRSMVSEEGARTSPSGHDGQPRYATFSMAFLLAQGTRGERALCDICNVPEDALWRRDTMAKLLSGLGVLDFTWVKADVVYLIPRDDGWGLTLADLAHPKFHYLRPLC